MTETNDRNKNKLPSHNLFTKSHVNGEQKLVKVGVAWKHSKGNGFNISLNDIVAFESSEYKEIPSVSSNLKPRL